MKPLLFLQKVSFFCNWCFIILIINRYYAFLGNTSIAKTIAVLGYLIGFTLNILICSLILIFLLFKKTNLSYLSTIITLFNIAILIFQLIYFYFNYGY